MPTKLEIESAAERAEFARKMREDRQQAIAVCGDGATAYAKWVLTDKTGREPNRVTFCCRRDGPWEPPAPTNEERMTYRDHAGYRLKDQILFPFRWQVGFAFLGEYHPETAEQLAERRVAKAQKKLADLEREQRSMLFPEVRETERARLLQLALP